MEMNTTQPSRRRRIYIIDREFQYAYMTTWILMTLGFIGGTLLVFYWAAHRAETRFASSALLEEVSFLLGRAAIFVVCFTLFMGCFFLLMSHRIAGPAYRIRKCLDRLVRGDYDFEVTLRKRDYLKDVADALNGAIRNLRARRDRVIALREQWRKIADRASAAADGARVAAEIEAAFDEILRVEPPGEDTKVVLMAEAPEHA